MQDVSRLASVALETSSKPALNVAQNVVREIAIAAENNEEIRNINVNGSERPFKCHWRSRRMFKCYLYTFMLY